MARELEELVVDARLLAITAKESESKLDAMLRRANLISGRLNMTREYQRDVEKMLVATGKLDRRKGLLEDLQRENRMIKSYEEENSMLRDQLEKSYATVDEIVARHREIMQRVQSEQAMCHLSPAMLQKICDSEFSCDVTARNEQIEQAHRLMDVMRYCEVVAQRDSEMFARVVKENRNLRELLNYASISDPAILSHFRASMQEYDRDQKARALSRKRAGVAEEGDDEEEEEEEEEDETSVLFNRSNLSQSTVGNATMPLATPSAGAKKRVANGGGPPVADGWRGFGGGGGSEGRAADEQQLVERVEDVLAGIDELSEEGSDAETVLEREAADERECEDGLREEEEDSAPDALASLSPPAAHSPPAHKEYDADSGTASSLSSSPASSSSSDGDNVEVVA